MFALNYNMQEIIFVVTESPEGGYEAEALGLSVFTQGDNWADLKNNILEAVSCHFEDEKNRTVRLQFRA